MLIPFFNASSSLESELLYPWPWWRQLEPSMIRATLFPGAARLAEVSQAGSCCPAAGSSQDSGPPGAGLEGVKLGRASCAGQGNWEHGVSLVHGYLALAGL